MSDLTQIVILTLIAGLAMPIGASLAAVERISPRWLETEVRHGVIAFGGGALLSAVALLPGSGSVFWVIWRLGRNPMRRTQYILKEKR